MYDFVIEYESYMGRVESMTISRVDSESEARRIFETQRPLSEIIKINRYDR